MDYCFLTFASSFFCACGVRSDDIQPKDYSAPIHVITGGSGATLHNNIIIPFKPIFEYVNQTEHGISLLEVSGKKN